MNLELRIKAFEARPASRSARRFANRLECNSRSDPQVRNQLRVFNKYNNINKFILHGRLKLWTPGRCLDTFSNLLLWSIETRIQKICSTTWDTDFNTGYDTVYHANTRIRQHKRLFV